MNRRTDAFTAVAAAVVAAASVGIALAAGTLVSPTADATVRAVAGVALRSSLADLTDLIQRLDAFLEAVLDLLRTVSRLLGAGEAGE